MQFVGVSNMATEVDMSLQEITQLLNDDVSEEEKFQVHNFNIYTLQYTLSSHNS